MIYLLWYFDDWSWHISLSLIPGAELKKIKCKVLKILNSYRFYIRRRHIAPKTKKKLWNEAIRVSRDLSIANVVNKSRHLRHLCFEAMWVAGFRSWHELNIVNFNNVVDPVVQNLSTNLKTIVLSFSIWSNLKSIALL